MTKYRILVNNSVKFDDLTEEEYFDIMEDLSIEFYQTGSPSPNEITTEFIE
jgi:hypothetical protein